MTYVGIIILHFSSAEHFLNSLALCVYNCIKFGKVLVIISSDFFSLFLSLFLETLIVHIFGGFMLSYLSLIVCSFSSPVYDLLLIPSSIFSTQNVVFFILELHCVAFKISSRAIFPQLCSITFLNILIKVFHNYPYQAAAFLYHFKHMEFFL